MSLKIILIYFLIFTSSLNSITAKNENSKKFLSQLGIKPKLISPISLLEENDKEVVSLATEFGFINVKCLYAAKGYNVYSLQKLQNKDKDYEIVAKDGTIKLNFCQNTKDTNATVIKVEKEKTTRLSGPIEGNGEDVNKWSEMISETDNKVLGVKIDLAQGEVCKDNERHQTTIKMFCDDSVKDEDFYQTLNYTGSGCSHIIEARSLYGCTLRSSYLFLRLLEDYKFVFAILFVAIGLILCFYGFKHKAKTVIIVCGFIGCYAITAAVLAWFPNFITDELGIIICLLVSFILGCLIGFFIKNDDTYYCLLAGGLIGYYASSYVFKIVSNYVEWNPQYLEYACIGVCIVVGALIGCKLTNIIIIMGTSILGGYLAMRGVSLIAGNYIDEGYLIDLIKNQEYDQLKEIRDGWVFGYLGACALLSIVGICIQCRHYKSSNSGKV